MGKSLLIKNICEEREVIQLTYQSTSTQRVGVLLLLLQFFLETLQAMSYYEISKYKRSDIVNKETAETLRVIATVLERNNATHLIDEIGKYDCKISQVLSMFAFDKLK